MTDTTGGHKPRARRSAADIRTGVLVGVLVALLTTIFQLVSSLTQEARTFAKQSQQEKYNLLSTYTVDVHRNVITLHKLKRMKWWLSHSHVGEKYDGAFTRDEVWVLYQRIFEGYLARDNTSALSVQVQVLFEDRAVREAAGSLSTLLGQFDDLSTEGIPIKRTMDSTLKSFYERYQTGEKALARAMATEIEGR